jgi:O-antigen/teichoic acid export membrane protein
MLKRLLRMFRALGIGIVALVVTQLLLPPLFLRCYSVARYGEWLVLSAALSYLSALNFGISTYASNQLVILYQRGEMKHFREIQASTQAILLVLLLCGVAICLLVFCLPLNTLLHLRLMSLQEARWTAFLLGLQLLVSIVAGYFNSLFVILKKAHRGLDWYNMRRFCTVAGCLPPMLVHAPFYWLALGQLVLVLLFTLLPILELKAGLKELHLGIAGATWKTARASIAPSGLYGLVFMQTYLVYQAPVIVLQCIVGPEMVVLFSISRTVLSVARQFLGTITEAIRPEITLAYGARDMKLLLQIFHYSEKVIYFLVPAANLGLLLFSPLLVRFWIHRENIFDLHVYAVMTLVSAAISMREHKQYFHYSTNTHQRYALILFFGDLLMIVFSIPAVRLFGMIGMVYIWLFTEVAQMLLIYEENKRLFARDASVNLNSALRMFLYFAVAFPFALGMIQLTRDLPLFEDVLFNSLACLLLAAASWFCFGVREVQSLLWKKMSARIPA